MEKRKVIILPIIFILLFGIIVFYNDDIALIINDELYIKELVASNKALIQDENGKYSDYLVLYNNTDKDIDLSNYYLSDSLTNEKMYKLDGIIKSKEEIYYFLDNKNYCDIYCHTNFKLSKSGDQISLINDNNEIINRVRFNELNSDEKLIYDNNEYIIVSNIIEENLIKINEIYFGDNSYIELYNDSNNEIDLKDYFVKVKNVTYNLEGIIKSKGYYVYDNNFDINNHNEVVYLYKNDNLIDKLEVNKINYNDSIGITNNNKVYYKNYTKNKQNSDNYYLGYTEVPTFSNEGGYISKGTKIKLISNYDIYYTLDGSKPTTKSKKYLGEIEINTNTVIRCIAVKENYLESDIVSRTYIVDRNSNLSIVSISTDSNNLYSQEKGILVKGYNAKDLLSISWS